MGVIIRQYDTSDLEEMMLIWNAVVLAGNAFPQETTLDQVQARNFFAEQSYTGVAEDEGEVVGLYILHPNNVGRCGHVANASYAVKENQRGKHIGELLVCDSMKKAASFGFTILQFNAVVATNSSAIALYEKLGFTRVGVVKKGFRLPDDSFEDIYIFTIDLS